MRNYSHMGPPCIGWVPVGWVPTKPLEEYPTWLLRAMNTRLSPEAKERHRNARIARKDAQKAVTKHIRAVEWDTREFTEQFRRLADVVQALSLGVAKLEMKAEANFAANYYEALGNFRRAIQNMPSIDGKVSRSALMQLLEQWIPEGK